MNYALPNNASWHTKPSWSFKLRKRHQTSFTWRQRSKRHLSDPPHRSYAWTKRIPHFITLKRYELAQRANEQAQAQRAGTSTTRRHRHNGQAQARIHWIADAHRLLKHDYTWPQMPQRAGTTSRHNETAQRAGTTSRHKHNVKAQAQRAGTSTNTLDRRCPPLAQARLHLAADAHRS